jgi:hypothetical protein
MHIPDGFLTGEAAAIGTATALAGVALCLHQAKRTTRARDLPVAGLAAAFFVVGDAPLVPLGVGTQAHLLGGALEVTLLGPSHGCRTFTGVTQSQALVRGDAGIVVHVIPGVSAALAAPAAAGIPLMLRQLSVTTTFVDGNDDPEHAQAPDWDALAKLNGTLVILTGRGHIRRIAAKLIAAGRPADTPIAAISAAGRPEQQVLRGTLEDLPAPLPPPVTFVVGEAAALNLVACTSPTAS